jgi:hypothetical protein
VNVEKLPDGRIKLSQPHLIDQILDMANLPPRSAGKTVPAPASKILHRYAAEPAFDNQFHYRGIVGKLNFLEKSTRPDIAYATHQIARFSQDPKRTHGEAVLWLCKYLRETRNDGLILDPRLDKIHKCTRTPISLATGTSLWPHKTSARPSLELDS